jgi:hypothetical protein
MVRNWMPNSGDLANGGQTVKELKVQEGMQRQ